jgi:hypothetical protein
MTAELTTIISQLSIAAGSWQRQAPNQVAVREPKRRLKSNISKGDLFVLAEVRAAGDDRTSLEKKVAEIIRDVYYTAPGSVIASLRRATQTAGDWLYRYNATAPEGAEPVVGGLAIVAVREADVFLAQVGPAAIYVTVEDEVFRFPSQSTWLDVALGAEELDTMALGLVPVVDLQLSHLKLSQGDLFVLADSRLAGQLPLADVKRAILQQRVEVAAKNLGEVAQARDCSALVIEAVQRNGKKPAPPAQTVGEPALSRSLAGPEPTRAGDAAMRQFQTVLPAFKLKHAAQRAAKGTLGTALLLGAGLRVLGQRLLPDSDDKPADQSRPLAGLRRAGATSHQPTVRGQSSGGKTLRYIAVGIPLIALLITSIMYLQRGRAQSAAYQENLVLAEAKLQEAQTADPAAAKVLLSDAESALNAAQTVNPNAPALEPLRQAVAERQDAVGRVQRLYYLPQLRQYTDPGTQLRRVVVQGVDVYVLDRGTDRVFHHRLDDAGEALLPDDAETLLLARDMQLDNLTVGEIVDVIWMPAGSGRQTSDVLILEDGALLEYNPSWGIAPSTIAAPDTWQSPTAVSSYYGNFYILDGPANSIKRYLPTVDGYSALPEEYFPSDVSVDLAGAVDLAIDGDVYVLYNNGAIRKFRGGEEVDFSFNGLDVPFKTPTAIFTAPDELVQAVYVADAGNQRIVELSKEGDYVRQFRPRAGEAITFDDLRDVFVDEISGRMYILNGNSLYGSTLPVQ